VSPGAAADFRRLAHWPTVTCLIAPIARDLLWRRLVPGRPGQAAAVDDPYLRALPHSYAGWVAGGAGDVRAPILIQWR
jgi:hypothetical protein